MKKMRRKKVNRNHMDKLLASLPPNYTVGTVYLNGQSVRVTNFVYSNDNLAHFITDGEVTVVRCSKIDGIKFAPTELEETEQTEEIEEDDECWC
ncbi:hypothetical protein IM538_07725 [Cytobacillus suaedae]|nr:hypothetical protein IM538_07725 [Cytobacillus suaedae]